MRIPKLLLICVAAFVFVTGYFANQVVQASSAAPGSSSDPLITKSFLEKSQKFQGDVIVIVRDNKDDARDAMAASSIVSKYNATIMYTKSGSLSASTKEALKKYGPNKVVLIGGTKAINVSVETAIKSIVGASKVQRIAGPTHTDTAIAVSKFVTGK